jgi:exopolyphosphatase/guanosine-5'-triphosphate,3'-diphosphate pyrophosphatase
MHRRKPDKAVILTLPVRYRALARYTTALLRLAVLFRRARRAESLPPMRLAATSQKLRLTLPLAWFEQHPLSESDLQQELSPMAELGLKLELSSS